MERWVGWWVMSGRYSCRCVTLITTRPTIPHPSHLSHGWGHGGRNEGGASRPRRLRSALIPHHPMPHHKTKRPEMQILWVLWWRVSGGWNGVAPVSSFITHGAHSTRHRHHNDNNLFLRVLGGWVGWVASGTVPCCLSS